MLQQVTSLIILDIFGYKCSSFSDAPLFSIDVCLMMSRQLNPEEAARRVVNEREDPSDCDFNFEEEEPSIAASLPTQSFAQDPFYTFSESSPSHNQQSGPTCSTPISQNSTNSELVSLLRKVVSGQEKLCEQVSDLQERLCTVEGCLSSLQSDSSAKKTTNRVASQLSVSTFILESRLSILSSYCVQYFMQSIHSCRKVFPCCTTPLMKRRSSKLVKSKLVQCSILAYMGFIRHTCVPGAGPL